MLKSLLTLAVTILAGSFLAWEIVRRAPGTGVDERELDARFSGESIRAIRRENAKASSWFEYVGRLARGDAGVSQALGQSVAELISDRAPLTLRNAGLGLAAGWALALSAAIAAVSRARVDQAAAAIGGMLLCVPAAVLGLVLVLLAAPAAVPIGIALAVAPRVFQYARNILHQAAAAPHVAVAVARGTGPARVMLRHVILPSAAPLAALAGVSVSMALSAAIPLEVICDSPGVGQLAWQAAMQRDVPLLAAVSLLVIALACVANALGEAS